MTAAADSRAGHALALVLVAMALLGAIASTAMIAALGQLRAAAVSGRVYEARTGARAALDRVLDLATGLPRSRVGDTATVLLNRGLGDHLATRVVDHRLGPEFHLLLGEARTSDGVGARLGRLVWWIDPASRVATHRAAIEAPAVRIAAGARVDTTSVLDPRRGVAACGHLPALAASPGPFFPASRPLPNPPVWGATEANSDLGRIRLGWLGPRLLRALADHAAVETVPLAAAGCTACWSGLVFHDGDAVISREHAGVLAVLGDLTFSAGANWSGLVLASGNVEVQRSATVRGLIRAGGTVALAPGSLVDGSACTALGSLANVGSLHRPVPLDARSWLMPVAAVPAPGRREEE